MLSPGTKLGPYEIQSALGAGGMSARGHAGVLASLNHPNIAAIYGLEEANGSLFLVLELVEGPTLAQLPAGAAGLTPRGVRLQADQGRLKPAATNADAAQASECHSR